MHRFVFIIALLASYASSYASAVSCQMHLPDILERIYSSDVLEVVLQLFVQLRGAAAGNQAVFPQARQQTAHADR
jgi:hypothetical protein